MLKEIEFNQKIYEEYYRQLDEAEKALGAENKTLEKRRELARQGTIAAIFNDTYPYKYCEKTNKATFKILCIASSSSPRFLGTFIIDFNFPMILQQSTPNETFSNPVLRTLITNKFLKGQHRNCTDKELQFIEQAEALQTALRKKSASISKKRRRATKIYRDSI